ncbi:MAG: hypothetical protein WBM02_12100 [bacterium]
MEYLGIIALIIIAGLIFFVLTLLIDAGIIYFATYCVSIPNRSFGKAFLTALASFFLSLLAGLAVGFIPRVGLAFSFGAGLLLSAVVIMNVYQTTFTKGLLADLIRKGIGLFVSALIIVLTILTIGLGTLQSLLMSPIW